MMAERASRECSGNGDGYDLLVRFYLHEESFFAFTAEERDTISRTARAFRQALVEAGFIEGKG
jgi:inosine/xanthosine triphosphate pyrophosphatase family protein